MLAAVLAVAALRVAAGEMTPDPSGMTAAERQVLATEDAYVAAEVGRDEAVLRRILDDRFVFNHNDGSTSGKEQLVEGVMGMRMAGQEITDRSVLVEGDVALVFGSCDIRFVGDDGTETLRRYRYTSTYVKRGEEWKFLALQMAGRPTQE